jgi:hypothetical protein
MTMVGENGPELDGWQLPPRCCGDWCEGQSCEVCGRWAHEIPANIVLGCE